MPRNSAGTPSEMRHRLDAHTRMTPSSSSETVQNTPGKKHVTMKRRDKGKKKAHGWGMGPDGWDVEERFRRFGEHCARNQIRTLLIDCLVMTNLFYPSLAIYLSKKFPPPSPDSPFALPRAGSSRVIPQENPFAVLSTRLLDSFFPYPPPLLPRLSWTGWWDHTPSNEEDGGWFLDRPEGEMDWLNDEVKVMRVAWADVGDVVDGPENKGSTWSERDMTILDILRSMAEGWEEDSGPGQGCVRDTSSGKGSCMLFSPDEVDEEVVRHIQMPPQRLKKTDDIYKGVVIPFRVGQGVLLDFEKRWAAEMASLAKKAQGEVFEEAKVTARGTDNTGTWLLTFQSDSLPQVVTPPEPTLSASPSKLVYVLYFALFSVLGHQLSTASKVHSRFGLAFTGCVQLCCSSVMSFSILALLGWNGWGVSMEPTTLPTYILPFVITVVGAGNMSALTRAVFSVPFTYSVPARIGLALSKVGISISITSLADLALLGVVWLFVNIRPVREFCVFAAVLIVTDWFMLHTFFLTVLSIDAQRLELADVLASSDGGVPFTDPSLKLKGSGEPVRRSWRQAIRARLRKSGSLIGLLCCVGVIYYLTERNRLPDTAASLYGYDPTSTSYQPPLQPTPTPFNLTSTSPSQRLWHALNPIGWPAIKISLPSASILVLPHTGHAMAPSSLRALAGNQPRSPYPRIKPLLHTIKVLVLPQAVTAFALWGILLYLLKDKDLLDAQRNKLGRELSRVSGEKKDHATSDTLANRLKVRMLPCTMASDVEVVESSPDGKLVITVSLDNSIHLWRFTDSESGGGTRERLEIVEEGAGVIVAAALSADGGWVAVLTMNGAVQIWEVEDTASATSVSSRKSTRAGRVTGLAFQSIPRETDDPFVMSRQPSSPSVGPPAVLLNMADGAVVSLDEAGESMVISPAGKGRSLFVPDTSGERCDVINETRGEVTLWRSAISGWDSTKLHSTRREGDRVTSSRGFNLNRAIFGMVYALGFASGLVEVFDTTGTLSVSINHNEPIISVDLSIPRNSTCTTCSSSLPIGFFLISTTATQTHIDLVHPRSNTPLCRCTASTPRRSTSSDDPSPSRRRSPQKSDSLIIPPSPQHLTPGNSPRRSPSLLPPVSNGEFPLSSHGTRRYSTLVHPEVTPSSNLETVSWSDLDTTSLGAIATSGGGGAILLGSQSDKIVALHRSGTGVNDDSWLILSLDLGAPWNGNTLVVESANLSTVEKKTAAEQNMGETSISTRRAERLLSLSGRTTFPSLSSGSAGIPGGMAYVDIRPLRNLGSNGVVGGFGNRLGVIMVHEEEKEVVDVGKMVKSVSSGRTGSPALGGMPFLAPPPSSSSFLSGTTGSSSSKKVS